MSNLLFGNYDTTRVLGTLGYWILRAWMGSVRFRFFVDDPKSLPHRMPCPGVYVIWHETLLMAIYTHADMIVPLISKSSDGEIASRIVELFGGGTIRGSTDHDAKSRGGRQAAWNLAETGRRRHLAITVDGPVGPNHIVSRGSIVVAARSNMPIVPVGFGACTFRYVYIGSSDRRLVIPHPLTRVCVVVGRGIHVARDDLAKTRREVQAALEDVQGRSEQLAQSTSCVPKSMSLSRARTM